MALAGVHLTFGYARVQGGYLKQFGATMLYKAVSSQTMSSAATSTISAPDTVDPLQRAIASINASAAIFYVVGPNPDINNGPRRYFDPSLNSRDDVLVDAGDKIAWVFA